MSDNEAGFLLILAVVAMVVALYLTLGVIR